MALVNCGGLRLAPLAQGERSGAEGGGGEQGGGDIGEGDGGVAPAPVGVLVVGEPGGGGGDEVGVFVRIDDVEGEGGGGGGEGGGGASPVQVPWGLRPARRWERGVLEGLGRGGHFLGGSAPGALVGRFWGRFWWGWGLLDAALAWGGVRFFGSFLAQDDMVAGGGFGWGVAFGGGVAFWWGSAAGGVFLGGGVGGGFWWWGLRFGGEVRLVAFFFGRRCWGWLLVVGFGWGWCGGPSARSSLRVTW